MASSPSLRFPLPATFVALPLEGAAKDAFREAQDRLSVHRDFLRLQRPDTPHLTLHYWPLVTQAEFTAICESCIAIVAKQNPFTFSVHGAATFGGREGDRVLFLTACPSPALEELHRCCPWRSLMQFHAHITLARIDDVQRFQAQKDSMLHVLEEVRFEVPADRLRLYAQVDGRRQTPVDDFLFH